MIRLLEVLTAADSLDLTTLASAKEEMGVTGTSDDGMIARWIREESAKIASYCNRVFGREEIRETIQVHDRVLRIALRRRPVELITLITEDGEDIDPANYILNAPAGVVNRVSDVGCPMPFARGPLIVEYWGGYSLIGSLPYELESACLVALGDRWRTKDRDAALRRIEIPGVATEEYAVTPQWAASGLLPEVEALVAAHRSVNI